jgi:hypothetical protein
MGNKDLSIFIDLRDVGATFTVASSVHQTHTYKGMRRERDGIFHSHHICALVFDSCSASIGVCVGELLWQWASEDCTCGAESP